MSRENKPRPDVPGSGPRLDVPGSGFLILGIVLGLVLVSSCSPSNQVTPSPTLIEESPTREVVSPSPVESPLPADETPAAESSPTPSTIPPTADASPPSGQADILEVKISGEVGNYNFSVTISSPDEGCSQYADWWEVISQEGELHYRRILLHSHVDEQPFTRSGGPVTIEADTIVLVRAHMNPGGYGSLAMKGSHEMGFEQVELSPDFAVGLEETSPFPAGCNF